MLKELFGGSTDFTAAIFKIPQVSKHFWATTYVYMFTVLHIKVIIQLKAVKSRPILISTIHENNKKRLNGLFESKHSTVTYHKRFLVSSWSKIHSAGK